MITEQFDRLYSDGASSPRLFLLPVRPWITGQPFRVKYFEAAIAAITDHKEIWTATGGQIADSYLENRAATT
jgi:hypothetical protein